MSYFDGFVFAVPEANRERFREGAQRFAEVLKSHGALRVMEGWGDDVPEGRLNSMHTAVLRQPGEVVMFSFVEWPDRAARDAGSAATMADPRLADNHPGDGGHPFDGARMIHGGFVPIVDV